MTMRLSGAIMAIATACMGDDRREWAAAMTAEYHVAAAEGQALSFAAGCMMAAGRGLVTSAHGRFLLTNYALALGIMLPMAALQIGCAVFGLPYLYPGHHGLSGALIEGMSSGWMHGFYQSAGSVLALLQLVIGIAHLRLAWVLLDRNWENALRWAARTMAISSTLTLFMCALFIDVGQAAIMGGITGLEFAILLIVSGWHADLRASLEVRQPV